MSRLRPKLGRYQSRLLHINRVAMEVGIGRDKEERLQVVKRVQTALHGQETQEKMSPARAPANRYPDQETGQRNADEEAERVWRRKSR